MNQMEICWLLRPGKIAQDLAGLSEVLDELVLADPNVSSATVAVASIVHVYANRLALFFTDQPLAQERVLEALEAQWLERRNAEGTKD